MFVQALIGTYRCTEVPGQFVWQPGSLLCAVTEGHWLLLEDLDSAPMDIVSVLVPLLETGTLSVPGHGGEVRANPNFRIFATRRYGHCLLSVLCIPLHCITELIEFCYFGLLFIRLLHLSNCTFCLYTEH